jgi:hypothetical protein
MNIKKELKHATFEYEEESKSFVINTEEGVVRLNKIYSFAFMRFVVRIAQRNWFRKKSLDNIEQDVLQSDQDEPENPNQLQMF